MAVRLRPTEPWRIGPASGARNRVDVIYHSDSLYSAVTLALARLGSLEAWLEATVRSTAPAVRFSSCFPFVEEIGFVVPPRTIWPPPGSALALSRVRWKSARFVPLGIVQALLAGQTLDDNQWSIDGPSECLVPTGRPGPFRTGIRWAAAVDRLTGASERHSTACIEFRPGAGLWAIVSFADDAARGRWADPVKAAFRLLADSGFGGERSRGWGRAEQPEFVEGTLPEMILGGQGPGAGGQGMENSASEASIPPASSPQPPAPEEPPAGATEDNASATSLLPPAPGPHWLLSLFVPAPEDSVEWSSGNYSVVTRAGRVESLAGCGELKKQIQMVEEGSVLVAAAAPRGLAADVAPDGFAHPVFRAGFALSIPLPPQPAKTGLAAGPGLPEAR